MQRISAFFTLTILLLSTPVISEESRQSFGGDEFLAGDKPSISTPVAGDVFAAGFATSISAPVAGDAHAVGFSVTIDGDVEGDIYAAGNSITLSGKTGQDISSAGASVSISGEGVGGNVRAAGAEITLSAPVAGSVNLAGASATIDSAIEGDFAFNGAMITFGSAAKINGTVLIRASSDVTVPAHVASADRVTIEKIQADEFARSASDITKYSVQGFWVLWIPFFASLIILPIVGVVWLALFQKRSVVAYKVAIAKPWKSLAFGVWGNAAFIGLIPTIAITLIGIPLIPVMVIILVVAIMIGYVAGVWFLAARIFEAFGFKGDSLGKRVLTLLAGLVVAWVLGFVPLLGWLIQMVFVFFGLGGIIFAALGRTIDKDFHNKMAEGLSAPAKEPEAQT